MLQEVYALVHATQRNLCKEAEFKSRRSEFVQLENRAALVAVHGRQHLLQRTIMKIALEVGHIFLVAYAAVQLVDVWEDLVVRELAIG